MPRSTDGRRCEWAQDYIQDENLMYLGPWDKDSAKLDLFCLKGCRTAYALPCVRRVGPGRESIGYAYTTGDYGDSGTVHDKGYAMHGGVTEEHADEAVRAAVKRAKVRGAWGRDHGN